MSDRALILAAIILGGAIIAAAMQTSSRYTLSAAGSNFAWRMDTWSGEIDICAAAYLATGPLVRCGVTVAMPESQDGAAPATPGTPAPDQAPPSEPPQSLDKLPRQSL